MRIKKHLLNERVITIGNIPAGEERTFKYNDWYFVISHAYDEDEDYEYTVYVTDSLTSKEYQYVYACENREEMMDYIARFLKNHKIDKEPEWDGEFDESKSYVKDAKKKIGEIVNKNGDIIKENYNRYLSPFMISPVIIWSEHDEIFDEIYDTLIGSGPTPTYARLANYDIKPLSNEYQRLLDTEIICLCATIDNHMLKVGIMFDDDMYNCLLACGFNPNGDGTWEINGENYSQEKAEKYYLDEYIKPSIGIAIRRLNEIHAVFDGEIYNNEKSYWGDILFGNSGNDTEPDDAGDEYDESYNPMLKEDVEENDPEWMKTPLGSDEYGNFSYGGYDFHINCYYDRDDEDNYYDLSIMNQKTDNALYEFGTNNWDELIDEIKDYVKKHSDIEPETDGSELDESKQLNENESETYEANNIDDLLHKMYLYSPRLDEGRSIFYCNYYTIVVEYLTDEDQDTEDDRHYYKARLYESEIEDETDAYVTEFSYSDYSTLCHNVANYIKNNPLVDNFDDDTEPEDDGSELNESWLPGAEWLDEPTPIGYSETHFYKGYDFAVEGVRDSDGEYYSLRVFIHDITDDDDALVQQESFDTWDELAFYVRDYVDEHPIKPDKKDDDTEPETDGSELNESKENNKQPLLEEDMSWMDEPPANGSDKFITCGGYDVQIESIWTNNEDLENHYIYNVTFYLHNDEEDDSIQHECVCNTWEEVCDTIKSYAKVNEPTEPETDGSELNEAENSVDDWKLHELEPGDSMLYNYKGYDLDIQHLTDKDNRYDVRIFKEGNGHILEWERFHSLEEMTRFIKNFFDGQEDPETDGSELNERFDMKTIKKQINEIVEKANG